MASVSDLDEQHRALGLVLRNIYIEGVGLPRGTRYAESKRLRAGRCWERRARAQGREVSCIAYRCERGGDVNEHITFEERTKTRGLDPWSTGGHFDCHRPASGVCQASGVRSEVPVSGRTLRRLFSLRSPLSPFSTYLFSASLMAPLSFPCTSLSLAL